MNPFGASAGETGELRFKELAANGSGYVGFKAPDSLTANTIWTLPSADGSNNYVLTTNGSGTTSWASVSGIGGLSGSGTTNSIARFTGTSSLGDSGLTDDGSVIGITRDISFTASTPSIALTNAETLTITDGTNTLFSLADAGTVGNLSGIGTLTAAGTVTFSNYSTGIAHFSSGGVISSSAVDLASADVTGILGVTNGGTGTNTSFTTGSVVFAGASGVYTQDNANFFFDDANNYFGLGTSTPGTRLDVAGLTLNTDADGTVGAGRFTTSVTKNDANARTFYGVNINPTINTGGSNSNTTVTALNVQTVETATTGTTINLFRLASGSTQRFAVTNGGAFTMSTGAVAGNGLNLVANSLTSGNGITVNSTAAALTGNLGLFSSTGNNTNITGTILKVENTGASSAATTLMVSNAGTSNGLRVNDDGSDTDSTPFIIDASGNVAIGATTAGSKLDINGDARVLAQGDVRFADSDSSNYVALQAPTSVGSNYTLTLPNAVAGGSNYALIGDATGALSWLDTSSIGGGADITAVGSITSGAAFSDTTADDDWLGLGSTAGRIEFDDQSTDEVNILSARLGVGTSTPGALTDFLATTEQLRLSYDGSNRASFTVSSDGDLTIAPTGSNTNLTGALDVSGLTLNTDADGTIGGARVTTTVTKNDTNTRTFYGARIIPTINTGGSNTNTTFHVLDIDTTNTAVTGVTTNLIKASYGGTTRMSLSSGGALTLSGSLGNISTSSTGNDINFSRNGANYITATDASGTLNLGARNVTGVLSILGGAANSLSIGSTATANTLFVGAGQVGIGNSAPGATLDVSGDILTRAQGDVRLSDSDSSNYVALQAPTSVGSNYTLTLPTAVAGGSNYALIGDATGALSWLDTSAIGGGADITAVGSITSGAAFSDTTADDDWLGLGSTAGRIEFDDQSTDEVNILSARLGVGTSTPAALTDFLATTEQLRLSYDGSNYSSFTTTSGGDLTISPSGSNIGINGAAFSAATLDIGGTGSTSNNIAINSALGTNQQAMIYFNDSDAGGAGDLGWAIGRLTYSSNPKNNLAFYEDDSTIRMTIEDGGQVGIGTIAPAAQLDVLATTEQLRLSYDVSNYGSFTISSAGDLTLAPSGGDTNITGTLTTSSNITVNAQGDIRLADSDSSNYVALQSPTTVGSNYTLTFPDAVAGGSNYALVGNGSGVLSWLDTSTFGTGDITAVGSMTSGAAFADTTADDDWLGLGSTAGRIEFDDQTTDEINFVNANVGIGNTAPSYPLHVTGNSYITGNVGMGTATPNAAYGLNIGTSPTDTSGTIIGARIISTAAPASGSSASFRGGFIQQESNTSQNITGTLMGLSVNSTKTGSGTDTEHNGFDSTINVNGGTVTTARNLYNIVAGGGNITTGRAIESRIRNTSNGTIGTASNFYIRTPENSGGGTITTQYGLYMEDLNIAGTSYAILTNAGDIVFNEGGDSATELRVEGDTDTALLFTQASTDRVGIGTSAPGAKLDVAGDIQVRAQGDVRFADSDTSNYVAFQAPTTVGSNYTLTLPNAVAGGSNYALVGDATGALSWLDTSSYGDITAVGSMTSGATFADTTADDDWLGLGSTAGRIEFDDQTTDEVNILSARLGVGTTAPAALTDFLGTTEQLRLSYDGSNYSSFTVSSGGDMTLAPSGGDTNLTGTLDVSGRSSFGNNSSISATDTLRVSQNDNSTSGFITAINSYIDVSPTGSSTGSYYGAILGLNTQTSNNLTGFVYGAQALVSNNNTGTVDQITGVDSSVYNGSSGTITDLFAFNSSLANYSNGTISRAAGLFVASMDNDGGTVSNNYGIYVAPQTEGSNDFGARIDAADTQTLWLSGNADNTNAGSGIAFGSSRDTTLYRSAANTLSTGGNITLNAQGDIRLSDSDSSNYIGIQAATTVDSNDVYTWPADLPAGSSYALTSNASGVLSWTDISASTGDITAVGSMTSGAAFADTTADDDWLGLGSTAGRIEFDDQSTDEVNILGANVGIGTSAPTTRLDVTGLTLNTDADGTVGASRLTTTITKNDTNTRTFYGTRIVPTLNTGGSNTATTLNVLSIDTVNTSVTGLTTNLANLAYGGSSEFRFSSDGNLYLNGASDCNGGCIGPSGIGSFFDYEINVHNGGNLTLTADGDVRVTADLDLRAQNDLRFSDSDSSNYVAFQAPTTVGSNYTLTLPNAVAGGSNYALVGDGTGALSWYDLSGATGDISAVGSMTSGAAFADTTADDDWLGLGSTAGRIEFDDQATDEVNILGARLGVGTTAPAAIADFLSTTEQLRLSYNSGNYSSFTTTSAGTLTIDPTGGSTELVGMLDLNSDGGNVGIGISEAVVRTLWLSSGSDPTTAAGGITFGVSADTTLYRSAAGTLATDGNFVVNAQGDVRFADSDSSNYVGFQAPTTVTSNLVWTLPASDGSSGYALTTNGSGTLSWTLAGGDITAVGSMTSGAAFADTTADDDWLGLGSTAGRIEFDDQATDEINFLGANIGIGTTAPVSKLDIVQTSSSTLTDYTQALTSSAINMVGTYGAGSNYIGGLSWSTSDNNATRPKAGIWASADGSGSSLYFGTSNGYSTGLTSTGMILTRDGYLSLGSGTSASSRLSIITSSASNVGTSIQGQAGQTADLLQLLADGGTYLSGFDENGYLGIGVQNPTVQLQVAGNAQLNAQGELRFADSDSSNYVGFKSPTTVTSNTVWTLPASDGSNGYALTTNGSGVLSWTAATGSGDITAVGSMTSGDAFADSTADDDWLGLGSTAGRIEFDDQATDEINFLGANVGIGTSTPTANLDLVSTNTTTNAFAITANTLTTGYAQSITSNSTALTSGRLFNLEWNPSTTTSATGDLARLSINGSANIGNFLNIVDDTTSLFSVSESAFTTSLPTSFTAPGDLSASYDMIFTNQTSSYIRSNAPLTLDTGESWESNDLSLITYNSGKVVAQTGTGGMDLSTSSTGTQLRFGSNQLDEGGYLVSTLPSQAIIAGGASWNGTNWIAKTTSSSLINQSSGSVVLYGDTGLTAGNTFTPTARWTFGPTGASNATTTATTTVGYEFLANSLTSGSAMSLTSNATTMTGRLLNVTASGSNAASTGQVARISATGASYAGPVLMLTNAGSGVGLRVNDDGTDTDSTPVVVDANGRLGVGLTAPSWLTSISGSQASTAIATIVNTNTANNTTTGVLRLGVGSNSTNTNPRFITFFAGATSDSNGTAVGRINLNNNAVNYATTGADYGEYFSIIEPADFGDMVAISENGVAKADSSSTQLLGVISDTTGFTGNTPEGDDATPDMKPVGLMGQVGTKVDTSNGPIKKGDFITVSSVNRGVGAKATSAGYAVGQAMEDFNGPGIKRIRVMVASTYTDPRKVNSKLTLDDNGFVTTDKFKANEIQIGPDGVDLMTTINNQLSALDSQATSINSLSTNFTSVQAQTDQRLAQIEHDVATMSASLAQVNSADVTKVASIEANLAILEQRTTTLEDTVASLSAKLNDLVLNGSAATESGILATSSATLDDLTVANNANINNLGVTGTISAGNLMIEGLDALSESSINTLGGTLKIQSLAVNDVEFEAGKIKMDTTGNMVVEGSITTSKVKINTSDTLGASAGKDTIPAGQTSIVVDTTAVKPESLIFVTATSKTGQVLSVSNQVAGTSFTVNIPAASTQNINFNWWIVDAVSP